MKFKSVLYLILAVITFSSCRKEQVVTLPSRQIEIDSVKSTGLTSFDLKLSINLSEGQTIQSVNLHFEDITVASAPSFDMPADISKIVNNILRVSMNTGRMNHDFALTATMHTDKAFFNSGKTMIRSPKNTFRVYTVDDTQYLIPGDKISFYLHRNRNLVFFIDYINPFTPVTKEVKLNDSIPIDCEIDFSSPSYGSAITAEGISTVPQTLPPGDYEIDVYLDGHRFTSEKKFRIAPGSWTRYDTIYPGEKYIERSWFLLGNELYLTGGHYPNTTVMDLPVWKFDMQSRQWKRLKDFPSTGDISYDAILPYNLQYGNEGYVLDSHNDSLKLWKYHESTDSWSIVSVFPGQAYTNMVSFVLGSILYLGGGIGDNYAYEHDFWGYDLASGMWTKHGDIPVTATSNYNAVCTASGKAYVFEYSRYLWEYDPVGDSWVMLPLFPGPRRSKTNIIVMGDGLFVIGGEYYQEYHPALEDCWKFSFSTGKWEMKYFLPYYYNYGLSFIWEGKVYAGYGFVVDLPNTVRQPELYQYNP